MKFIVGVVAGVAACVSTLAQAGQVDPKLKAVDLRPYEKAKFPKLYAQYGAKFVRDDIQKVRVAAANEMAKETKCDRVLWSEYSDIRSTPDQVVVFVDCANGYRIIYGGGRILKTEQLGSRLD